MTESFNLPITTALQNLWRCQYSQHTETRAEFVVEIGWVAEGFELEKKTIINIKACFAKTEKKYISHACISQDFITLTSNRVSLLDIIIEVHEEKISFQTSEPKPSFHSNYLMHYLILIISLVALLSMH